jgi:hypothetical protein
MAAAFVSQLGLTQQQAECVARHTIESAGLQHLVDIGMFDADLTFHDLDLATHPEVKQALTDATLACAGS